MKDPKANLVAAHAAQLNIYSVRRLEFLLGIRRPQLFEAAGRSGALYRPFLFTPTGPLYRATRQGKERIIERPIQPLQFIQKRIHRRLLRNLEVPGYLFGGAKGKGLLDNISLHLGAASLVTVDIRKFFPSIRHTQVFSIWRKTLDCSDEIASLLTRLTTFERHLPQGASTSTTLANLVLYSIDHEIRRRCCELGVCYSSWVDDLAFSGENATKLIPDVISVLASSGFAIGREKLKIMGPGSQKVLHGIVINRYPKLLPARLSELRSAIHRLKIGQISSSFRRDYVESLSGAIATVEAISERQGQKLRRDLNAVVHLCRHVDSGKIARHRSKVRYTVRGLGRSHDSL